MADTEKVTKVICGLQGCLGVGYFENMVEKTGAAIPEAYFEYRADLSHPMFEVWTLPNPMVQGLYSTLRRWNLTLADITSNKEAKNYKDLQFTFNVASLNATIRVGLDAVTFMAGNPDWSKAPALLALFEAALNSIQGIAKVEISMQEVFLALHVTPGSESSGSIMAKLVNSSLLGPAETYGVSAYRQDSSLVMDKSLRYEGGVFVRLQRKFPPDVAFPDLAMTMYTDELNALTLLGLRELLQE